MLQVSTGNRCWARRKPGAGGAESTSRVLREVSRGVYEKARRSIDSRGQRVDPELPCDRFSAHRLILTHAIDKDSPSSIATAHFNAPHHSIPFTPVNIRGSMEVVRDRETMYVRGGATG